MQDYYRILDPIGGARRGPQGPTVGSLLGTRPKRAPRRGPEGAREGLSSGGSRRGSSQARYACRDGSIRGAGLDAVPGLMAEGPEVRWFDDEVVVDFPSAAALAERARRRFVERDERRAAAVVHLAVTDLEAARGGRHPVRLSLPATCSACGGRGESWGARCDRCAGTGTACAWCYVILRLPPGVRDGDALQFRLCDPNAPARVTVRVAVR